MESIYHWIGLIVFWLSALAGSLFVMAIIGRLVLDELGRKFKVMWLMVEYARYKKDFSLWVKDKKRHPRAI